MKRFEFMTRGAITALAAFGALAICPAAQAQSVSVNSAQVCVSAPSLTMDPSGNLNITCTPVGTGGTPTMPSCSVPAATVQVGGTAFVTANCSGGAITSYAWTNTNSAPGFPASLPSTASISSNGPFTAAMVGNTFSFSVMATNAAGQSPAATGVLTVIPAPTGGGTPGCPATPTNAVFSGTFTGDKPTIITGSFASYVLPQYSAASNTYQNFTAVESNNTVTGLRIQYVVSPCVGDFTSTAIPAFCKAFGTANSGITLNAYQGATAGTAGANVCIIQPNTQYYLNVRTVKNDGTNSCPASTCSLYVQFHSLTY